MHAEKQMYRKAISVPTHVVMSSCRHPDVLIYPKICIPVSDPKDLDPGSCMIINLHMCTALMIDPHEQ